MQDPCGPQIRKPTEPIPSINPLSKYAINAQLEMNSIIITVALGF